MTQGWRYLSDALGWFAVVSPVVLVLLVFVHRHRVRTSSTAPALRATVLDGLVAFALLGILAVTLLPLAPRATGWAWGVQWIPLTSIMAAVTDSVDASVWIRTVLMNVVLFVPLGLALVLRGHRIRAAVGFATTTSLLVEILQMVLPLGRTTNIDDVILNTVGGLLGAVLGRCGRGRPVRAFSVAVRAAEWRSGDGGS